MTRRTWTTTLLAAAVLAAAPASGAARDAVPLQLGEAPPANTADVGVDEKLGGQVPLELTFRDEANQPVSLRQCVDGKPTILVLAYYRCPMLCTQVLNGLVEALRGVDAYTIGREFNVVTVSFDPKEAPELAAQKKAAYVAEYGRPDAEKGWRFLTGAKDPISVLTQSVGYRYEFDKAFKEYNHASVIMVLTPDGRVSRYMYGIDFRDPKRTADPNEARSTVNLRLALVEAGQGQIGTTGDKLLMLCYRFDHLSKGYALNVMRVVQAGGIVTVFGIAAAVVYFVRRDRRRSRTAAVAAAATANPEPAA